MNQLSCVYVFCFFKQKTAYEMRISDWSSDVCSSDLASELLGISQIGNDPKHRVSLRSSMDIGPRINVDADLRYVSRLPDPHVPGYVELGARIGWRFIDEAELSISGFNLLHNRPYELPATQASPVPRRVYRSAEHTS